MQSVKNCERSSKIGLLFVVCFVVSLRCVHSLNDFIYISIQRFSAHFQLDLYVEDAHYALAHALLTLQIIVGRTLSAVCKMYLHVIHSSSL